MKKHDRARRLAELISPYLYGTISPSPKLNECFLRWLNTKVVPDMGEILEAANELKATHSRDATKT